MIYIFIAIGGALGAVARFATTQATARLLGTAFPYGTLIVNLLGSFAIGLLAGYFLSRSGFDGARAFLITGFLGGFTTFSALSLDALMQIQKGAIAQAFFYIGASVAFSLLAVFLGFWLMRGATS